MISRHDLAHSITWRGLLALAANDLGVHLVSAGIQQFDRLVFELPHITVEAKVGFVLVNALTRDQLGRFNSYRLGLCYYRRLCRAARQVKAD